MKKFFAAVGWTLLFLGIWQGLQYFFAYAFMFLADPGAFLTPNVQEMAARLSAANLQTAVYATGVSDALLIGILLLFKSKGEKLKERYRFHRLSALNALSVIGMGIGVYFGVAFLVGVMPWPEAWMRQMERFQEVIMGGPFLVQLLIVALIAPVAEELLFRGAVYRSLGRGLGKPVAFVLQAMLFGLVHSAYIQMVYAFALGLVLAALLEWTKSMWAPILLHIFINGLSCVISEIGQESVMSYVQRYPMVVVLVMMFLFVCIILGTIGMVLLNRRKAPVPNPVFPAGYPAAPGYMPPSGMMPPPGSAPSPFGNTPPSDDGPHNV